MKQNNASANITLDTRSTNRDGKHPVKIRVCHLRKQWAVSVGVYLTATEYKKIIHEGGKINLEQKEIRKQLAELKKKAQYVLDTIKIVTPDNFKKNFFSEADIATVDNQAECNISFPFT